MHQEPEDYKKGNLETDSNIKESFLNSEQKKPKKYLGIILILFVIGIIVIGSVFFYIKKPEEIIVEEAPNIIVDYLNTHLSLCSGTESKVCKVVNTDDFSICQNILKVV